MNVNSIIIVASLLLCCVLCDDNDERKLSVQLNPGCVEQMAEDCYDLTFVHIEAEGRNDTIHYIWDFTGSPSLFLAKTDKNATLNINWSNFMQGSANSLNFTSPPSFIFSAVIHKILVFDDPSDAADVNDASVKEVHHIDPHRFTWNRENITEFDDQVTMLMNATVAGTNGSFAVKVTHDAETFFEFFIEFYFLAALSLRLHQPWRRLPSSLSLISLDAVRSYRRQNTFDELLNPSSRRRVPRRVVGEQERRNFQAE
jgi:Lysosomal transcription factor, NCU-G1